MPMTPEGEAHLEELRRRRAAAVVPVRPEFLGPTFALSAVEVGWWLNSADRTYHGGSLDGEPLGGVVVDILAGYTDLDTGEVTPTRYHVLNVARREQPWQYLEAPEVDLTTLGGIERRSCSTACYWLLRQINARHMVVSPADLEHLRSAYVLAVAAVEL